MPGFKDGSIIKDRYQILSFLGGGLFSEVYKAKDLINDRIISLKILKPEYKEIPEYSSRIAKEFYFLTHFNHPNIITVLDFNYTENSLPFFTMEYFEGLPIDKFFQNGYNDDLLLVLIEILKALDFIHSFSVIHGDLKPEHILVSMKIDKYGEKEPIVKLLDFGFTEKVSSLSLELGGTIGYCAPELLKGTYIDPRTDFYSLGVILYEIITKEGPKKYSDNILKFLEMIIKEKIPFCEEVAKKNNLPIPPKKFSLLVHSLLSYNVNRRPNYAYQIFEVIKPLLKKEKSFEFKIYRKSITPTSFIGREDILEKLKNLFKQVKEENQSKFVLIFGERGVGKSRLAQEFKYFVQVENALTFNFTGGSLGGRYFSLLEQLLKTFSLYNKELLNFKIDLEEWDIETAQKELYTLYEMIFQTILEVRKKENRPLFLFFDDLELMDGLSLNLFRYITYGLEKDGIFVLGCSLKEERFKEFCALFKKRETFSLIELSPLNEEESFLLIKDLLPSCVNLEELSNGIYTLTGGNPLFIIEIIHHLLESEILIFTNGKFSYDKEKFEKFLMDFTSYPTNISTIIKNRIKRLSKEELEILRIGAIFGKPFSDGLIKKTLNYEEDFIYKKLQNLINSNFLKPVISEKGSKYYFTSKVLEAVIQEGIFYEERKLYHQKIANALELLEPKDKDEILFDLAFHYAQGENLAEALYYTSIAAEKAKSLSLFKESLVFYEMKLKFLPKTAKPIERINTMEEIGKLRELLGLYNEAIDIYKQAISVAFTDKEILKEKSIISKFLRKQGVVSLHLGKYEEAINYFDEGLNFEKDLKSEMAIKLLTDKSFALIETNRLEEAEKILEKALNLSSNLKKKVEKRIKASIYYNLSVLYWHQGKLDDAIRIIKNVMEIGKEFEPNLFNRFEQFYASLLFMKGNLEEAEKIYKKSYNESLERKSMANILSAEIGLGSIFGEKYDFDKAKYYFEEALSKARKTGMREQERICLINLAGLYSFYNWQRAEEIYQELIGIYENQQKDYYYYLLHINYLELLIKMGKLKEAEDYLKILLEENKTKISEYYLNDLLTKSIILYYLAKGDFSQCHFYFEELKNLVKKLNREENIEFQLFFGEFYFLFSEIKKAKECAEKVLSKVSDKKEIFAYLNSERLLGACEMLLGRLEEGKERLFSVLSQYKKLNIKYELAKTLLFLTIGYKKISETLTPTFIFSDTIGFKSLDNKELQSLKSYLEEAKLIFEDYNAKMDLELIELLEKQIQELEKSGTLKASEKTQYLKIFYQISEIINLGIEKEDFFEKIIDLTIDATGAERGILFLFHQDKLVPVAARAIDHSTLEDATQISMTAIKRIKYVPEPILVSDALNDPRFKSAKSVILNKIRSLLCVPLKTNEKIVGAIYLDSRITSHIFLEEDRSLLMSIAHLLAATIDKSNIFTRIQTDAIVSQERFVVDEKTGFILGKSKQMKQIYELIEKVAPAECTILLTGETGTGKNVLAEYIHQKSRRRDKKFYTINCGALPETLFESELFGHVKGSFTGAVRDKEGLLEMADGGTIFLDEISNIPLNTQPKILEFLETKVIRRVGSTETKRVDVRLICATNKNLEEEVKKGTFKEDLYYRINAVTIHLPPLRERKGDIPYFANHFLKRFSQIYNKSIIGFDELAMAVLMEYPWPGNIRELQNLIHYAVVASTKKRISIDDLIKIKPQFSEIAQKITTEKTSKKTLSKEEIIEVLKSTKGNVSHAAQQLGIHRRQLQRLIKRYNIDRTQFKEII
ncbi:MAG: sigma 54-interacting transcriptional regulator [candidate division WOR-3 bacterium]|nr:sigma 54-interacting transcriptional regulator [candidate division WOR-3 bacterium]